MRTGQARCLLTSEHGRRALAAHRQISYPRRPPAGFRSPIGTGTGTGLGAGWG